jgi:hypothetical protein
MSMTGLVGETFVQAEVEFHRARAMQEYNRRRPHRKHNRHLAWPFARSTSGTRQRRPAVS